MTSARSAHLLRSADPVPAGAFFVEARYFTPEGEWQPQIHSAAMAAVDNGVLAAPPSAGSGRFPLPDRAVLRATLADWGITTETPILVYSVDPDEMKCATRAWFVLREAGVRDVRVIDGGIAGWLSRKDRDTATTAAPGDGASVGVEALDADAAADVGLSGVLLDARGADAYVAGHIPGAVSAPGSDVFREGWLLPEPELRAWARSLLPEGAERVGAYCGGGVAASGVVFALATLGIDAGLYVDSWSQWGRDANRPAETH